MDFLWAERTFELLNILYMDRWNKKPDMWELITRAYNDGLLTFEENEYLRYNGFQEYRSLNWISF